jgi:hypothetical protein
MNTQVLKLSAILDFIKCDWEENTFAVLLNKNSFLQKPTQFNFIND